MYLIKYFKFIAFMIFIFMHSSSNKYLIRQKNNLQLNSIISEWLVHILFDTTIIHLK